MSIYQDLLQVFVERFAEEAPLAVQAPGRVNIIGEHTDYNDGFVFPMAIDRSLYIALRPRSDRIVTVQSLDFDRTIEFDLDHLDPSQKGFPSYIQGMAWGLQGAGYTLTGFDGIMKGNVPLGSGLSSSAALELAVARAFALVSGFDWDPIEMAKLAQFVENKWVGVQCGIMDQLISATGIVDHAILIDCRSLELKPIQLPLNTRIVILDTGSRRGLVDGAYNERRQQCEEVARFFRVETLRDVSLSDLESQAEELDEISYKRAHHVITENERTLQAYQAMQVNNPTLLGQLMIESHASLRDDFEVSSHALDLMVEIALNQEGCYGARMTGAGFGGCAVALVDVNAVETFVEAVMKAYDARSEYEAQIYVCRASAGASVLRDEP